MRITQRRFGLVGSLVLSMTAVFSPVSAQDNRARPSAPMQLAPVPMSPNAKPNFTAPVPVPAPRSEIGGSQAAPPPPPPVAAPAQPVAPPAAGMTPPATAAVPPATAVQTAVNRVPEPLTNPVRREPPRALRGIDPAARDIVQNLNNYFNTLRFLNADFVQVGPDGRRTTGKLYMDKPGRMRFQYDPPSSIELIADGQTVAVRDRKLATQDVYSLNQTPLRYLLSERIDLTRDANVVGITRDNDYVTVMLEEKQVLGGTNKLMILFNASDMRLRQWTVTDAQGYDTAVAIHNINTAVRPDQKLFRIDTTRIIQ